MLFFSPVHQIVGPPGCGKTQFCMLLSVVAALPHSVGGRGTHVLYVDTEASFSAERYKIIIIIRTGVLWL